MSETNVIPIGQTMFYDRIATEGKMSLVNEDIVEVL